MSSLRTFIAVDIAAPIQKIIQQKTDTLRTSLGTALVRWVNADNIHLTLKFLGDIAPAQVDDLKQLLRTEADQVRAFDLQIGGCGSFPNWKRPRVLFIGLQAPAELEALYRGIESACTRLGYESETRGFSPHLTIGRVREGLSTADLQKIRQTVEGSKVDSLGTARVDSVHLYKSDLRPTGSVYTRLFSAPLKISH